MNQFRPEHDKVRRKTEDDEEYNQTYLDTIRWEKLTFRMKAWILTAAFLIYSSCPVFAFKASLAFENFEVSGHIDDDLEAYGLSGNAMNIVKKPGYILLGMFFVGVVLHVLFVQVTGFMASNRGTGRSTRAPRSQGQGQELGFDARVSSESPPLVPGRNTPAALSKGQGQEPGFGARSSSESRPLVPSRSTPAPRPQGQGQEPGFGTRSSLERQPLVLPHGQGHR